MITDPDYSRIFTKARCIAWTYGYAAVVHGSFTRDLDILLVPWAETATDDPERIIDMLCASCDLLKKGEPSAKPHGRTAYTLMFSEFGDPRFVDVSVMPQAEPLTQDADVQTQQAAAWRAVFDALKSAMPGFHDLKPTGKDSAVEAIRLLAEKAKPTPVPVYTADQIKDALQRAGHAQVADDLLVELTGGAS